MNYESMSTSANSNETANFKRIVLTRSFVHFMGERYNEYTEWLLDTYGHEAHQYGLDLLDVSKDDVDTIQDLYHYFLQQQHSSSNE